MQVKRLIAAAVITATAMVANAAEFGNRGYWEKGYAQGYNEYVSGAGGVTLNITCDNNEGMASNFMLVTPRGVFENFELLIDGKKYLGMSPLSSLGASHFQPAYNALRKAKSITAIVNGKQYPIPAKNAGKVLPAWGGKNFDCNAW